MVVVNVLGKEINYKPFIDDMYVKKLEIKIMGNKSFIRVFQKNLTTPFYNAMKESLDPDRIFITNTIWQVFGESGTGKSMIVMSIIKHVTNNFTHNNMCFFDEEILEKSKQLPKCSFIVRDEGTDKAQFGMGSNRTSRQLQVLGETCRKAGLSLVFIEPEAKENELAKYIIETVDFDIVNRITRCALIEPRSKQVMGAIYVPVLPEDDPDWIEYNKRKDTFIENTMMGDFSDSKKNYLDMAKELHDKLKSYYFETKGERLTYIQAKHPNLTGAEIKTIANMLEIMLKTDNVNIFEDMENE